MPMGYGNPRIRLLSIQYSNTDTLNANSGTQTHATTFSVPANVINLGMALRVTFGMFLTTSAATVPGIAYALRLGGTTVASMTSTVALASLATRGFGLQYLIAGTAAPGASVSVSTEALGTHPWAGIYGGFPITTMNATAQPVAAIATNGSLTIDLQWTTTNSTAGNTSGLRQLIVEQLGP